MNGKRKEAGVVSWPGGSNVKVLALEAKVRWFKSLNGVL